MLNVGKLSGYTLLITGASRGIGKAIALKAARDGANVVIAAKTTEPHPKLPGTIYTAAEEIEKAGGKCLPCVVDVRNEQDVEESVRKAVKHFGGIDILINNASAISLTGTLATPMKKYDLMNQVNTRGTYLCSKVCLPHLLASKKAGRNPHILNISPPLNMKPVWFKNHTAYTIAKFGMSMCVLGMAEELKEDGIAVNALWPQTAIQTAAMDMLGGGTAQEMCRKTDIMADAAYAILIKDVTKCTGRFVIDEDILREEGITDLEQYSCVPGSNLLPDFFLDAAEEQYEKSLLDQVNQKKAAHQSSKSTSDVFEEIANSLNSDLVNSIGGIFKFKLIGETPDTWIVDFKTGKGGVRQGDEDADVTMTLSGEDFVKLFSGMLAPTQAFMQGKLKIDGNMAMAMKLEKVMKAMSSAPTNAGSATSGVMDQMRRMISKELVENISAVFQFKLSDGETYTLNLKSGEGGLDKGATENPDVVMTMKEKDFIEIFSGKVNSMNAFMAGKLKIEGNMEKAMKLSKLVRPESHL